MASISPHSLSRLLSILLHAHKEITKGNHKPLRACIRIAHQGQTEETPRDWSRDHPIDDRITSEDRMETLLSTTPP